MHRKDRPPRKGLAALLAALALAATGAAGSGIRPPRPNVVLIVADDLGYGGVGCYGEKEIPTPHIDSLARNGVRFTNGYVTCPVCSPTRAALMTGRYQQRFGHEFNPGPAGLADPQFGLPLTETTLADRLKAAGYRTGMVGKWHLGDSESHHPMRRGFDEFYGFLGGAHSYVDAGDDRNPILRGTMPVDQTEYLTDVFAREAAAFIDRSRRRPFFLYLPLNAVHAPMQAPKKYLDRFPDLSGRRRTHAAMLSAMDDAIGEVLETLRRTRLEEKTLIFFISDNGGPTAQTTSRNGPLGGFKGQVLEGGIRVPFIMQWKGRLPAGQVYEQPVVSLDILPTALAAAGVKLPDRAATDGVNLTPFLVNGSTGPPHSALYWRFGPQAAVRKGDWKLVLMGERPPRLYDLATDVGEKRDLAEDRPLKRMQLEAALEAWDSQLAEPRWGRARRINLRRAQPGRR